MLNLSVSVIIPAFNAAGCVSRAIESALAQTYRPLEILVIDDGSGDNTAEVVSRFPLPVRLLRQANGGPGAARNHGARFAEGEWLAFLDADDVWLPHKLERQRAYVRSSRVGIVHSRQPSTITPANATFESIWKDNCIQLSSAIVRREAFEQVKGFDEDRALIGVEDWNLWLRLAAAEWEIVLCPETLHHYTPAPGNLSSQTERILKADLANVDKIGRALHLPVRMVGTKRAALLEDCGRTFLTERNAGLARRLFASSLRSEPSVARCGLWLTTFVPLSALDLRRKLIRRSVRRSQV